MFLNLLLLVFEEKMSGHDNNPNYDDGELALKSDNYRHSRNNSRTVQLEYG